ncbi:UNVERIFIED_CONTAM: hypothetical protein Sradi_6979900 [Sesamum radiatum]|uniref:DUF4218 domain-containing protein n=1 Tax=Sesamum radiatum TaxID=300843 RepID=A0AAW2JEQ4_SESRA
MHIEKNVFDDIFNIVINIKEKAKDNLNARKDLMIICNRLKFEVDKRRLNVMPKALYTLTKEQKMRCEWISHLKFPDGYASNLTGCVDMKEMRPHGMKSDDCHVFVLKFIPTAFHEMLPKPVWSALTVVSLLFKILCSMTLDINKVQELEASITTILSNLKKIFLQTFFNSMRHLIVHLPYEAHVGGFAQYMWMYPFESLDSGYSKSSVLRTSSNHTTVADDDEDIMHKLPNGITQEDWEELINYFESDEFKGMEYGVSSNPGLGVYALIRETMLLQIDRHRNLLPIRSITVATDFVERKRFSKYKGDTAVIYCQGTDPLLGTHRPRYTLRLQWSRLIMTMSLT